jgi:hypothetical protein
MACYRDSCYVFLLFKCYGYIHISRSAILCNEIRSILMTNTVLDIIHRSVFYVNHIVSETRFCPCLEVDFTQIGR